MAKTPEEMKNEELLNAFAEQAILISTPPACYQASGRELHDDLRAKVLERMEPATPAPIAAKKTGGEVTVNCISNLRLIEESIAAQTEKCTEGQHHYFRNSKRYLYCPQCGKSLYGQSSLPDYKVLGRKLFDMNKYAKGRIQWDESGYVCRKYLGEAMRALKALKELSNEQ